MRKTLICHRNVLAKMQRVSNSTQKVASLTSGPSYRQIATPDQRLTNGASNRASILSCASSRDWSH